MSEKNLLEFLMEYEEIKPAFEVKPLQDGKSVEITNYVGSSVKVRIPSTIQKLQVTHIGNGAFRQKNLESVTIPKGVISIGASAFNSNRLTSITIPDGVTIIGNGAFTNNQLTTVVIPDSVTTIGQQAFIGNPLENVTIPSSVTEVFRDWSGRDRSWFGEPFPNMPGDMFDSYVRTSFGLTDAQSKFIPGNYIYRDGRWTSSSSSEPPQAISTPADNSNSVTFGILTITGIPAGFDNKYIMSNWDGLIGAEKINSISDGGYPFNFTLPKISNGEVKIPLWIKNENDSDYKRYSGNNSFDFQFFIYENRIIDDNYEGDWVAKIEFGRITFNNGNAVCNWSTGRFRYN